MAPARRREPLAVTHPDLAAQLVDPAIARQVTAGSDRVVEWECDCRGHTYRWPAPVNRRALAGAGCPVATGKVVLAGVNDLATTHPRLAAQLVDRDAGETVTAGSTRVVEWECRCTDHRYRWRAPVCNRTAGRGCPVASGQAVLVGYNNLGTTHPALAGQLVEPALALEVTAGSGRRVGWRCDCPDGPHVWLAAVYNRTAGTGCPEARRRVR